MSELITDSGADKQRILRAKDYQELVKAPTHGILYLRRQGAALAYGKALNIRYFVATSNESEIPIEEDIHPRRIY